MGIARRKLDGRGAVTSTARTGRFFRLADMMREVGGDVYHRGLGGWWDRARRLETALISASWESISVKSDMGQLIYAFLYTVDPSVQGLPASIPTGY